MKRAAGHEDDLGPFLDPVLVIVAHPDDVEAHRAGTVARLVAPGRRVAYGLATSGNRGTSDPAMTAERLQELREAEQLAAARTVGVDDVTFLRHDGANSPSTCPGCAPT